MPSEWDYNRCGTVALMILGQFSDICDLHSEYFSETYSIRF